MLPFELSSRGVVNEKQWWGKKDKYRQIGYLITFFDMESLSQKSEEPTLIEKMDEVAPREVSGSSTSSRYDFQKNWAICLLLESHKNMADYLIVLDYHEDIILINSETNPKQGTFFQVKTKKKGNWTLSELLKRNKDKLSLSIVGKMYDNKIKFGFRAEKLKMVSNAPFKIKLHDQDSDSLDKSKICLLELEDSQLRKICESLISEHGLTQPPSFSQCTFLEVVDLHIDDHSVHTRGKLVDFLSGTLGDNKYNIDFVYKTLFDEITRKTNYSVNDSDFDGKTKKKAIGKSYFSKMIEGISRENGLEEKWKLIEQRLGVEGVNVIYLKRLRAEFRNVSIDSLDPSNESFQMARQKVKDLVKVLLQEDANRSLIDTCEATFELYMQDGRVSRLPYQHDFVITLILLELYE